MMKAFNSLQVVAIFAAWPALMFYLHSATFKGASLALCVAGACYVVGFIMITICVYNTMDKNDL